MSSRVSRLKKMGWFSDDSGDDEPASSAQALNEADDEEDPLDAYMNSLDNSATIVKPCAGRLDHDAEDEATSHWEMKNPASSLNWESSRLLPTNTHAEFEDKNDVQSSAREAKLAMSSTFVKAGGKRAHDNLKDDNEEEEPSLQHLAQQHVEMQHQEITPLEKINHNSIRYPPFRRMFVTPKNTAGADKWREEHDITCIPPIDPILNFDQEIFPQELVKKIAKSGYDSPTLVQCQTLGVALAGRDGLITAATGSGKSKT